MEEIQIEIKENGRRFAYDEEFNFVMMLIDAENNVKAEVAGVDMNDLLKRAGRLSDRLYENAGEVEVFSNGEIKRPCH